MGTNAGEIVIGPSKARGVLSGVGWLAKQPKDFQANVFQRASLVQYAAGEVIYLIGDPLGGIYGVVSGAVLVMVAPPKATPQPMHVITAGGWIGEGPFLSRDPRRVGLRAATETQALYLPLDAMDQMASQDPTVIRPFTQILLINLDLLVRAFYDLQDPDEYKRIARSLRRVVASEGVPIPLTQTALGIMSNASRKTVNAALQRFEKAGWVKSGYRAITITDLEALREYAEGTSD
jgi:CRP-like cAMP-binding protein